MPHQPASDILTDIKVLDLTRVRAGPTCARQLADWGADVIKVEMPDKDPTGSAGLGGPRAGSDFQNLHRNKRSLTLNLKEATGVEIFKKLVKNADVVIENYRPDVKHRLGIDYESLRAVNPRIIYASISGFGQDGPIAKRPGFDQIAQGMGGIMSVTGEPGRGPMRAGIPVADLCAGLFASQGIMLALHKRQRTGEGQWIQSSLLQSMVFMMDFQASRWLMDGEAPQQAGNNHPTSIPTGVFETSDGHINIASAGQAIWARFRDLLNDERMSGPDYDTGEARSKNRDALNAMITEHTRKQTSAQWIEQLNDAGVPCGEINNMQQVFEMAQTQHLGLAWDVDSHERGKSQLVGQPIIMSDTKASITMPPPTIGEHSNEILSDLGYSADQIKQLDSDGVI